MAWLLMLAIVVLNTVAQRFFKLGAGQGLINASLALGVAAYGLSTVLYVVVLGRSSLSFAYPTIIGATAVATCFMGMRLMGERLAPGQLLGVAFIIAGIFFVALGKTNP